MHLHPGHVHVDLEIDCADIDKLTAAIAKIDHGLVVTFSKAAFAIDQVHGQIVDSLSNEWRAGSLCGAKSLHAKFPTLKIVIIAMTSAIHFNPERIRDRI